LRFFEDDRPRSDRSITHGTEDPKAKNPSFPVRSSPGADFGVDVNDSESGEAMVKKGSLLSHRESLQNKNSSIIDKKSNQE
jgi:hypothetical protein